MRIGSLFSGIGGLELGLERAGLGHVAWQAEIDPWRRAVLERHWPDAERYRDVRAVSFPLATDVLCGGFPCRDVSVAGKGAGLDGKHSGLWSEFARVIGECAPRVVVIENVSRGRSRWLPGVTHTLEALGYVPAAVSLSAAAFGAPHERARTFVIADPDAKLLRLLEQREPARPPSGVRDEGQAVAVDDGEARHVAGPSAWATLPGVRGMDDGVSARLDRDADRTARIAALGDAVVPQMAEAIGRLVKEALS